MKQKERFLNQINTKINNDNPNIVIGNVVDHIVIVNENTLKEEDWLTVNFKSFLAHKSFEKANINSLKYFFNKYDMTIKSYMVIFEESLRFRVFFQNDEYYNLIACKFPSEMEVLDKDNKLITVFKF